MGRPLNKKYFGNTNDSGLGGEGVASVTVTGAGTGYTDGDAVVFSAPQLAGGVTATGVVVDDPVDGTVNSISITDKEALEAGIMLTKTEGILPALESSHAIAALEKLKFNENEVVVLNLSGRGDKDLETFINAQKNE